MTCKYRMKDQERYKLLCAALPNFKKYFESVTEDEYNNEFDDSLRFHCYGIEYGWSVRIAKSEIEKLVEYTPCCWNRYPEVTPPEDVLMRVEYRHENEYIDTGNGKLFRNVWIWLKGKWHWANDNIPVPVVDRVRAVRFRPWEAE